MTGPGWYLGIETSSRVTEVAMLGPDGKIWPASTDRDGHNGVLVDLIRGVTAKAGIRPPSLAGIGVTIGPGMFTSLRVGLAVAKGLAAAYDLPIRGISTFAALARTVGPTDAIVLCLVDARKEQVYAHAGCGDRVLLHPSVLSPGQVATLAARLAGGGRLLLAGDAVGVCLDRIATGAEATDTGVRQPCGGAVAQLARTAMAADDTDEADRLAPVYLRRTDAELRREATA